MFKLQSLFTWLIVAIAAFIAYTTLFAPTPAKYQQLQLDLQQIANKLKQAKSGKHKTILMPLPEIDFDPTEVAVAWHIFTNIYGFDVVFASEKGADAFLEADPITLRGKGLNSITKALFSLLSLFATDEVVVLYEQMRKSTSYRHPLAFVQIQVDQYDGLYLAGGHAQGMKKEYLDSRLLQAKVAEFWQTKKPVAAVCHGVLVLARSTDKNTNKSVLFGKRTTSLTNVQEGIAYWATRWFLGNLYKTYEESTEDEVQRAVYGSEKIDDAHIAKHNKLQLYDQGPFASTKASMNQIVVPGAFIVEDGNYVSGRWPGDVHVLAARFAQKLIEQE